MRLLFLFLLITTCVSIDFKPLDFTQYKTNPQYGVIFRAVHNNFLPTDSYLALVFKIPFPELPVMPIPQSIDSSICHRNYSVPLWQVRQAFFMDKVKDKDYLEARLSRFHYAGSQFTKTKDEANVDNIPISDAAASILRNFDDIRLRKRYDDIAHRLGIKRKQNCTIILKALNATLTKYQAARNDVFCSYQGLAASVSQTFNELEKMRYKMAHILLIRRWRINTYTIGQIII